MVRLILVFSLVPLIELVLLVWLAQRTSLGLTVALLLATGLAGAWLARQQGWRTWRRIHEDLARGRLPADSLLDGLLILVAALLLLTPGVLTDLAGLLLLLPPGRRLARRHIARRLRARLFGRTGDSARDDPAERSRGRDRIIDARVIDVPSEPRQGHED